MNIHSMAARAEGHQSNGAWLSMPWWGWVLLIAFAAIDPISHALILLFPPVGYVPTGFHTMDYYLYTTCMNHFSEQFSPYATALSPVGDVDPSFYALPYDYLYGWLGTIARMLHAPPFFVLAVANGLAVSALLLASWSLLIATTPRLARVAFSLFALGGGIGGFLYVLHHIAGLDQAQGFGRWFYRFALYELQDGPRHQPYLLIERLYYSLPLAFGIAALAFLVRTGQSLARRNTILALLSLAACTFFNFRLGPMIWTVAVLYVLGKPGVSLHRRATLTLLLTTSLLIAGALAYRMVHRNPEYIASMFSVSLGLLWLIPFVYALGLSTLLLPMGVGAMAGLPRWLRILGAGATGYFVVFVLSLVGYQAYYGNWLVGGDTNGAIAVSDWALLGVPVGLLVGYAWRPLSDTSFDEGWYYLWGLAYLALSVSAFGQGWFIGFMPQRFIVVTGLPIAVVSAYGLEALRLRLPRVATGVHATILAGGIVSIIVTWSFTYGPWGVETLQKAYPWNRYAYMTTADAALLEKLDRDVVLAPATGGPTYGDIAVFQGNTTVYGKGTLDFSRFVLSDHIQPVLAFYRAGTPEAERRNFVQRFGITAVFCPDIDPVAPAVLDELRALPWLEAVASEGRGMVFRVRQEELGALTFISAPSGITP